MSEQPAFLKLEPTYRDYVWGGDRLRPGYVPTAEAWVVWEGDQIANGPLAGQTLKDVAAQYGVKLLGTKAVRATGERFPLLIKLLDCEQWLSLQVHPDDALAAELHGPGEFGKTEAWHILDALPDAKLILGIDPEISQGALSDLIRNGEIKHHLQSVKAQSGETIFMPAGTIHALGPGLLIYEVQQTSNWTYRLYDWDRPATPERPLHLEESARAAQVNSEARVKAPPETANGSRHELITCQYFTLELLSAQTDPIALDTAGETFHAVTVIAGQARLTTDNEQIELGQFETALVSANTGAYRFEPLKDCRALKASL